MALADAVNDKCAGSGGDVLDSEEEDMEEVDGAFVRLDGAMSVTIADPNRSRILEVADLVNDEIDIGTGGQIKVSEVVPFVVLKLDPRVDKSWAIPGPALFEDLMNRVSSVCLEHNVPSYRAYEWATLWGKVGLLGLSSASVEDMIEYRKVVEAQMSGPIRFTLFPKDALEKRGNLTVLLRDNLQTFDIRWLPKAILMRSRMRGGLRLTHIKHYRPEDKTREGVSKKGWRLALMQGCPEFMEALKKFNQEHRFPVGAGHVVIRGGGGRPKGTIERVRGSRGGGPRQRGRQQQDQPQQQPRRPRQMEDRREQDRDRSRSRDRGTENERNYDKNYPRWGRDRDRDRERNNAGNTASGGSSSKSAWGKPGTKQHRSGR